MNDFLPKFEGREVDGSLVKITSRDMPALDDLEGVTLGVDDRIQLKTMFTVIGVNHQVDKDGKLIRVHTLRPVDVSLAPIAGTQDGVLRALPAGFGASDDDPDEDD